jgi:hypothetical protein
MKSYMLSLRVKNIFRAYKLTILQLSSQGCTHYRLKKTRKIIFYTTNGNMNPHIRVNVSLCQKLRST